MAENVLASDQAHLDRPCLHRLIVWTLASGLWLLLAAALVSHNSADWPSHTILPHHGQTQNWVGSVGAVISYKLYLVIGPGTWIAVVALGVGLVRTLINRPISQPVLGALGVVFMTVTTSALVRLSMPGLSSAPEGAGGLLSVFINDQLLQRFNMIGTAVILTVGFWLGAVLAMDRWLLALGRTLGQRVVALAKLRLPTPGLGSALKSLRPGVSGENLIHLRQRVPVRRSGRRIEDPDDPDHIDENAGGLGATEAFDPEAGSKPLRNRVVEEEDYEDENDEQEEGGEVDAEENEVSDHQTNGEVHDAPGAYLKQKNFDPEALRAKIRKMPINFASKAEQKLLPPREVDLSGYHFPNLDLLINPESHFTDEHEKIVRDQAVDLESALQQYRIEGEVVGIDSGPVITLFEVRLAPGTKVAQINAIASDIARALRAQNIRVVPNMVGKDTVGVEVPNLMKEKVRLKELITVDPDVTTNMKLPMFLAKDASGNPLIADLAAMPHMLIAGTTGSGKSVCMNSIIMSFLYTRRPDELKLVLVDPKMVEMSMFKDIPHLMCPVVTEMSRATAILEWAVTKMDERYELLAEAGVRDVATYNSLEPDELLLRFNPPDEAEATRIPRKLPYIVFIIDELADLIITNKEVEHFIVRLAQKARAVGIHLILATQRPQANVVTGLIKSNMPSRVSFKVASGMDSRIVLDEKGAELLLGQGDMLYRSPRTSKLTRAQGTLVDDLEIRKVVRFLNGIAEQSFEPQLMKLKAPGLGEGSEFDDRERDPLFDDAVEIVLESRRGSVSLLQRRLTVGYSRASRLIEQIAEAGIIGEYKGSQAREVLISLEEWEALKAQAEADAQDETMTEPAGLTNADDEEASDDEDELEEEEDAVDEDEEDASEEEEEEEEHVTR